VNRAYAYEAKVDGDHVVVTVKNEGAGHNFPTELKQRSVESLMIVRDLDGQEVARSRMVFRDPYKRPYGLELPVNTQIPAARSARTASRSASRRARSRPRCSFKLYYPIDDYHTDMSRVLEARTPAVLGSHAVDRRGGERARSRRQDAGEHPPEVASVANLVDYNRPKIGTVAVDIPTGSTPEDIQKLIDLFQFPVPQANDEARDDSRRSACPRCPR
jgi:hypothetical protein